MNVHTPRCACQATASTSGIAISNVTHGYGWQTFDPHCQISNVLHEYLMLRRPAGIPAEKNIRWVFMPVKCDRPAHTILSYLAHHGHTSHPPNPSHYLTQLIVSHTFLSILLLGDSVDRHPILWYGSIMVSVEFVWKA